MERKDSVLSKEDYSKEEHERAYGHTRFSWVPTVFVKPFLTAVIISACIVKADEHI
jgi:hypothetical protein